MTEPQPDLASHPALSGLIRHLATHPDQHLSEIASMLDRNSGAVSRDVTRLQDAGYLTTRWCIGRRGRQRRCSLTPAGRLALLTLEETP